MHGEGLFLQAFVYLAAAVVAVPIAKRLGLGSVLGYLAAGVAIGPWALGLVGEEGHDVLQFAEFGVVLMLFLIGLELEPERLWRLRGPILGLGGLQVLVTGAAIAGLSLALGLSWRAAVAVGLTLALSSTASVLQTLAEKGWMDTAAGQGSFSVLLFQDVAVIPMLALFPLLAPPGHHAAETGHGGHGSTWTEGLAPWAETLVVLGAVIAIVAIGRFLVRPLLRTIACTGLPELFTASSLLLVIGIALLMTRVGLSPALGTFLAGVVLANSEYRHELEADIAPFKGLLLAVFFIAVGASIDFGLVAGRPGVILGLAAVLVVVKALVLFALAKLFRHGLDQALVLALALAQGGEFAFVLFGFLAQQGIVGAEVTGPAIAVVALSMTTTPLLLLGAEKLLLPRLGTREAEARPEDAPAGDQPVILAGFGGFGQVVGRLLRAAGFEATVLDHDSDRVDLLRRLGFRVFYGDATRPALLRSAGAAEARLIILALDSPERNRELARVVREHFPHLEILARAPGRTDAYELLEDGVDRVYRETLDTSLRVGVDALRVLGVRAHRAHRTAQRFRRRDEAALRELAALRHDRDRYLVAARERIEELEETLRDDLASRPEVADAGWDAASLREEYGRGRTSS